MQPQQLFALIVPTAATLISGWLRSHQLPAKANLIIVLAVSLLLSVVYAFVGPSLTRAGVVVDSATLTAATIALLLTLLKPIVDYLSKTLPSPFNVLIEDVEPYVFSESEVSSQPVKEPAPIVLTPARPSSSSTPAQPSSPAQSDQASTQKPDAPAQ